MISLIDILAIALRDGWRRDEESPQATSLRMSALIELLRLHEFEKEGEMQMMIVPDKVACALLKCANSGVLSNGVTGGPWRSWMAINNDAEIRDWLKKHERTVGIRQVGWIRSLESKIWHRWTGCRTIYHDGAKCYRPFCGASLLNVEKLLDLDDIPPLRRCKHCERIRLRENEELSSGLLRKVLCV